MNIAKLLIVAKEGMYLICNVMTQMLKRAFYFYLNGFREMTLGRTLWFIILLKLFILFAILRLFFFPNYIKEKAKQGEEAEFVVNELIERGEVKP